MYFTVQSVSSGFDIPASEMPVTAVTRAPSFFGMSSILCEIIDLPMNLEIPESWVERLPFLEALNRSWRPLPRWAVGCWLAFYALFLFQLARGSGFLPMIDLVFVPFHEGGHLLFGYLGHALMIAGGTILQLAVPLVLAGYFCFQRQIAGTVFCLFCFFEQFLPIATYMADARAQELPLLTVGNPEFVEHDWFAMFSSMGLLQHDTQIASVVHTVGWIGMIAVTGWLLWRGLGKSTADDKLPI
jgi:hypothetical protein